MPVVIEKNVWQATGYTILEGYIGEGAVVTCGAIEKNVEPYTIVGESLQE